MLATIISAAIAGLTSIAVAAIGIIPTIVSNRKKTQESIKESNTQTSASISEIKKTLDSHIAENEATEARNRRYRILRFYDEICEGRRHSESHFEDILDDIDDYEKYCSDHPDFKNNRGEIAMRNIRLTYERIKTNGGFLAHEERKGA